MQCGVDAEVAGGRRVVRLGLNLHIRDAVIRIEIDRVDAQLGEDDQSHAVGPRRDQFQGAGLIVLLKCLDQCQQVPLDLLAGSHDHPLHEPDRQRQHHTQSRRNQPPAPLGLNRHK